MREHPGGQRSARGCFAGGCPKGRPCFLRLGLRGPGLRVGVAFFLRLDKIVKLSTTPCIGRAAHCLAALPLLRQRS